MTNSFTPKISIVTPFYNESEGIEAYFEAVLRTLESVHDVTFELVCVNDGSADDTLARLNAYADRDPRIVVIDLSRNFGKEAALTAGIDLARGRAVIPFDADLQDPPELIPELIQRWRAGEEIVLARRVDRSSDLFAKRWSAAAFYRFHNLISEPKLPQNVGDFRIMDRVVVEALRQLPERQRFMKGLFAWVGFRASVIDYERMPRAKGKTKFSGWRLWNLALEGLTSFSTAPLRMWTYIGSIVSLGAFVYGVLIVTLVLFRGVDVPGYASLLVAVLMLGGVQLIGIGVLGEYIGRIYSEAKQRPVYIVRSVRGRD